MAEEERWRVSVMEDGAGEAGGRDVLKGSLGEDPKEWGVL